MVKKITLPAQVHTQLEVTLNESEKEEELGYVYHQNTTGLAWQTCLLINSEISMDIFKGVHKAKKPLTGLAISRSGIAHVTFDSKDRDQVFKVFTKEGVIEFALHETGLHYFDLEAQHESGVALVATIMNNFEGYTKCKVEGLMLMICLAKTFQA